MIKIAVIGPESSGKSTLCAALAEHFNVDFIPEYSREFLSELNRSYVEEDLTEIANSQMNLIKNAEAKGGPILITDTDSIVVKIWSMVKYGRVSEEITSLIRSQTFDLYLLCNTDVEWQFDELREVPDKMERDKIFNLFVNELDSYCFTYRVISGQNSERTDLAIAYIKALL